MSSAVWCLFRHTFKSVKHSTHYPLRLVGESSLVSEQLECGFYMGFLMVFGRNGKKYGESVKTKNVAVKFVSQLPNLSH